MIVSAYEQRGCLKYPIIFPVVRKPELLQKVAVADKMTLIETSMWIWTLGYSSGWPEAEQYSKIFRENDINGSMLPSLSLHILQNGLGIRNPNHCMTIKSAIDLLFPNTKKREIKAPFEIERGVDSKDKRESLSSPTLTNSSSVGVICESVFSTTFTSSSGDSSMNSRTLQFEKNTVSRSRCLILTLRRDQRSLVRKSQQLKNRFAEFDYTVEILPHRFKPDSYIVIFDDEEIALRAIAHSKVIGYNLAEYHDGRPSPNNLHRFKTLIKLKVRAGMSLRDRKIGVLKKNEIVTMNEVQGRRARVTYIQDKETMTSGWVSLYSGTGTPFLERLN